MMDMGSMGSSGGSSSMGVTGNVQGTMGMAPSGNVQGTMEMGNYSTGGVLNGLLSTVTQLLFVALILSIVIGLAIWLKNSYFKESYNRSKQVISNDPMLKTIFVLASTLVGVIVVLYLLGILMNGGFNPNQMGLVTAWSVSGILTFFVKVLTILFVVALIAFLFNYVKQNITSTSMTSPTGAILTSGNELNSKSETTEDKPATNKD